MEKSQFKVGDRFICINKKNAHVVQIRKINGTVINYFDVDSGDSINWDIESFMRNYRRITKLEKVMK